MDFLKFEGEDAGMKKVKNTNGSNLAIRRIDVLACLPLRMLAWLAPRDLADQGRDVYFGPPVIELKLNASRGAAIG